MDRAMERQRKLAVAALVVLLGVAAIATTVVLQQRAARGQRAELRLAAIKLELSTLQNAPFKATLATGGSPEIARQLLLIGRRQIDSGLAQLQRDGAPAALTSLRAPLQTNFETLQQIYRIGVATNGYGTNADRLSGQAARSQARVATLLDTAATTYRQRAERSDREATIGAAGAIVVLVFAFGFLFRQNRRLLDASRRDALVDALTGLGNRRALVRDLGDHVAHASDEHPALLALFDLDGFKHYNDTFGHLAGDALLTRLGERLRSDLHGHATVYRMGGDEFCLLDMADDDTTGDTIRRAAAALCESGETFAITCSYGSARIPMEAATAEHALHLADQRMYAQKVDTLSASRQSADVLLQVISERSDRLDEHAGSVGALAGRLAGRLGLTDAEQARIQLAARLHDIGKTAIPDSLLDKRGPLSEEEWVFMRRHTLIGERIVRAAPSLAATGDLIRSSHERVDGSGYPDQLRGDEIPIGSRIIAVCDAYDAMTSTRAYRAAMTSVDALDELERQAGAQFDPEVAHAFIELMREQSTVRLVRAA
jgi:diguanylate cyclase (GGDEF)-like protein